MLERPRSVLFQDPSVAKRVELPPSKNGAAQASKELFHADPIVADPQMDGPVSLGTTIMAVSFKGGVLLAADSRTSTGTYVVNRTSNKLTKLTSNIYCCRSGSAADTQALAEVTSNYLEQYAIDVGAQPTVAAAASLFQKMCYANKWNISAGIIVAGYDNINGGSVYSIPSGGSCVKLDYAIGGSGSIFLYSYMDSNFRRDMTKDECIDFCRRCVSHALSRDGSSGGVVRTIAITADGSEHSTTAWTTIPYCMERDPQHQTQSNQNQPFSSTAKEQPNVRDSTATNM